MHPVTHLLLSWTVAEAARLERKDRTLVTLAGVLPDLDGLGAVAEIATSDSARPLYWWSEAEPGIREIGWQMLERSLVLVSIGLAMALILGGCATHKESFSDLPVRELAGHYTPGSGESWFRVCGAAEGDPPWWVTFTEHSVAQADQARASGHLLPGQSYFVRWRAAVTTKGEVGPQGPGTPALLVREVLELRPAGDDDCEGAPAQPAAD